MDELAVDFCAIRGCDEGPLCGKIALILISGWLGSFVWQSLCRMAVWGFRRGLRVKGSSKMMKIGRIVGWARVRIKAPSIQGAFLYI